MDKAYIVGVDMNAGIGATRWDPPLPEFFHSRLATGTIPEEELSLFKSEQTLVINNLLLPSSGSHWHVNSIFRGCACFAQFY